MCFALARSYAQTRLSRIRISMYVSAVLDCSGGVRCTGMTGYEMTMRFHGLKQVHNAVPWQNVIR